VLCIKWTYKAKTKESKKIKGYIYINSRQEANKILRDRGYRVLSLNKDYNIEIFKKRITNEDMAELFSDMSILMEAGISVTDSWDIAMNNTMNDELQKFMRAIYLDMSAGKTLYISLKKEIKIPKLVLAILKAGERTGELVKAFEQAAIYYGQKNTTMKRLQGAMFYPTFTVIAAITVLYGISVKVMPVIMESMGDNVEKNIVTDMLMGASSFFEKYKLIPFIIIGVIGVLIYRLAKTKLKKQFLLD